MGEGLDGLGSVGGREFLSFSSSLRHTRRSANILKLLLRSNSKTNYGDLFCRYDPYVPREGGSGGPGGSGAPSKTQRLQEEVDQVKNIIHSNINAVVDRGERLENLQDKTGEHLISLLLLFLLLRGALSKYHLSLWFNGRSVARGTFLNLSLLSRSTCSWMDIIFRLCF